MGTLLGWLRFRSARRLAGRMPPALRRVKYVLFGAVVVLAALGNLTLLVLDPLALLTRTTTTSVIPGFVYLVDALERAGMTWGPTVGAVQWTEETLRGTVLPTIQPRYEQGIALLPRAARDRPAERARRPVLVPLPVPAGRPARAGRQGAAAAAGDQRRLRRLRRLRHGLPAGRDRGRRPGVRARPAAKGAVTSPPAQLVSSECTMCLDCLVACPREGGVSLGVARPGPWAEYDPGRREVVIAAAAGVGAALLFGTGVARAVKRPGLIRPPGAQDEARFLSRCLRCSECMKACPTSGLQPTLGEAGLEGLWTPVLKSRLGYCDYACTACGQVCPSGAIPPLPLERKRAQVIGVAVIDRDRCLPWAADTPCIVCQEMCPRAREGRRAAAGA